MAAQGGFGVVLKINTGSLTAVTGVTNVDFPEFMKYLAESTGHDSSGGYYEAVATGKRRLNPFPVEINWDTAEATHAAIHEFGGVIKAKNGGYLRFKTKDGFWHTVKEVTIPARPYVRPAFYEKMDEALSEFGRLLVNHFERIALS